MKVDFEIRKKPNKHNERLIKWCQGSTLEDGETLTMQIGDLKIVVTKKVETP